MYAYRDIWPLMTFSLRPRDEGEGYILWVKMALAGVAGIMLPLFEPYPYIPVDPKVSICPYYPMDSPLTLMCRTLSRSQTQSKPRLFSRS